VLVAASYLAVPLMDQVTLRWFSRDLNSRGLLVANALSDSVTQALAQQGLAAQLRPLFDRARRRTSGCMRWAFAALRAPAAEHRALS
jgi:RecB family endonuclease NucS